jgi:glycosyltransferase involved in cell wall biosynthesis
MTPCVSVIVPLYNKERYINRCLEAVLSQSLSDFELIVVNDGSTDQGPAKVEQVSDPRVKLVHQVNAGPGAARNRGVELAAAPLVAFLDGDDAWHPDYLRESVAWMERVSEDVASVTWGMRIFPQDYTTEQRWTNLHIPQGEFRATPETSFRVIVAMLANMLPSSTVVRRKTFLELGGYYAKYRCLYSEDAYLYLNLLLHYGAAFDYRPLTLRYEDASELAVNQKGVRPIEPFLLDPGDLERDCPAPLRPLLRQVLTARALKTASVYGYWGQSQKAREIFARFASAGDWSRPYFAAAVLGCTPVGGWIGGLARKVHRG